MRPPSDTVSAFFPCLLAQRWEDAASLADEQAVEEWETVVQAWRPEASLAFPTGRLTRQFPISPISTCDIPPQVR